MWTPHYWGTTASSPVLRHKFHSSPWGLEPDKKKEQVQLVKWWKPNFTGEKSTWVRTSFSLIMHGLRLPTFLLLQEVNSSLQNGGLVHFAWMALTLQHGAQLLDEHIKLVSSFLFRFVTRCPSVTKENNNKSVEIEDSDFWRVPVLHLSYTNIQ